LRLEVDGGAALSHRHSTSIDGNPCKRVVWRFHHHAITRQFRTITNARQSISLASRPRRRSPRTVDLALGRCPMRIRIAAFPTPSAFGLSLVTSAVLHAASSAGLAPVPFQVSENRNIAILVALNGHGPFTFLLDTGSNRSAVSARVASALGLTR